MKVKNTVFASQSERLNFYKLSRTWGDKYRIYQNIPFLNIFDVRETELSQAVFEYLKKTSVDYVICDQEDSPLIAIEFDGMQQGVSIGTEYRPQKGFDFRRRKSLQVKLQIAHRCEFPLFVVGDREFEDIPSDVKLTIVDGVIGCILAEKAFEHEFQERDFLAFVGYTDEEFGALDREQQQNLVDKFGIDVEVTAELENNPIDREAWRLVAQLRDEIETWGYGGIAVPDPSLFAGMRCFIRSRRHGHIERRVVVPRFDVPGLKGVLTLARDIAQLLAFSELRRRVENSDCT
jgi:hypothetical protein